MVSPNVAVIVGSSKGIGLHLTRAYLARTDLQIVSLSRSPKEARKAILDTKLASPLSTGTKSSEKKANEDASKLASFDQSRLTNLEIDVRKEDSIAQAASEVEKKFGKGSLKLLFNVAGKLTPEKNLQQVEYEEMLHQFQINTFFPLLSFKHFSPLLPKPGDTPSKDDPCLSHGLLPRDLSILTSLSARVGSISDNKRGGWYSYRSSKAAQNQITRSLSIELANKSSAALAVALHPGTVRTDLSKEFTANRELGKGEFEAPEAASNLIEVLSKLKKEDNGKFLDWEGKEVGW